jgi:hypothetical protein
MGHAQYRYLFSSFLTESQGLGATLGSLNFVRSSVAGDLTFGKTYAKVGFRELILSSRIAVWQFHSIVVIQMKAIAAGWRWPSICVEKVAGQQNGKREE